MSRSKFLFATHSFFRFLCLVLSLSIFVSLYAPLFHSVAAQTERQQQPEHMTRSGQTNAPLGKNLPDLTRIRGLKTVQPSAPVPIRASRPCFDCERTNVLSGAFSVARTEPRNRTGTPAVDLLSQNFHWSKSLVALDGRAKLNLNLALVYNSLVWTKAGSQIAFDVDRGQLSPGFRLGFPTIQPRYLNAQTGKYAYLLLTPEGNRVELRETGEPNTYAATDDSLLQMIDRGLSGAVLRRPDGTQLNFEWIGGQLQCTEIKDRNGNYITAGYNKRGYISSITDTLGRTLAFDRDRGGNLLSITQKDKGAERRVLATFGYSDLTVQTNFAGLEVLGPPDGSTITVLTQVGLPDGTRYQFDYTSWGQVKRITLHALDNHTLAYTSYSLPEDGNSGMADCPRPTEMRNWTENSNGDSEVVTRFNFDENGAWGQAILADGSTRKEFFGTIGWQQGLSVRTEDWDASGTLQKSVVTEWAQQNEDGHYRIVPHSRETSSIDGKGNQRRTVTEYTNFGLPKAVYEYASDGITLLHRTHTEYNLNTVYLSRHIVGLVSEQVTYDTGGAVIAKTTHAYDLEGSLVDQGLAVQHDNANYGADFLVGRGLVCVVRRWDAKDPNNEAKAVETRTGYNTTGSAAFVRNPSGGQTNVSYTDNFADGKDRGTLAFATMAIHPDGNRTLTKYDYDTGALVWNQDPQGVAKTFTYDAAGRMTATTDQTTGASARRVYDETGTVVTTFSKVKATAKEVGRYTVYDGAKRVRAIAVDTLDSTTGYGGIYITRNAVGQIVDRTKLTKVTSTWVVAESPVAISSGGSLELENDPYLRPPPSDGGGGDPYGNSWFYGDQWGYDWYWDWTGFADALFWGDSNYWYSSDWDTLSYLAQLSDRELDVQLQFGISGYFNYATNVQWNGNGYSGSLPTWVVNSLYNDPSFANGSLYGFHTDVGRHLVDFRSYTGTFGDGSLQIVIDQRTGRFHTDVDRFNPYQDVVNFFGHAFIEVVPSLFRRLF